MRIFSTLLFILCYQVVFSQTDQSFPNPPLFKISSFSLYYEALNLSGYSTEEVIGSHASGRFVPLDLNTYGEGAFYGPSGAIQNFTFPERISGRLSASSLNASIGITSFNIKKHRYRSQQELILGVSYKPVIYHNANYNRLNAYSDSITIDYAYYMEKTRFLSVNAGYLFKSNPNRTVVVYAGINGAFGMSVHPVSTQQYGTLIETLDPNNVSGISFDISEISNEITTVRSATSYLIEGRVPVGLSVTIVNGLKYLFNLNGVFSQQIPSEGENYHLHAGISWGMGFKYEL